LAPRPTTKVSIPPAEADQPKLLQVGAIALVCFAVGMLWPTLWGASLVPSVPGSETEDKPKAKPKTDSPDPNRIADPGREVPAAAMVPQLPAAGAPGSSAPRATVQKALVVNCRDEQDRRIDQCDSPGFDEVAKSRLEALAACPAAATANGTLSIGFDLDFTKEKVVKISSGKSNTFDGPTTDALLECSRREFMSATLKGVTHTHARYLIFYTVQLGPAGVPASGAPLADPVVTANGFATVIWNSARVRTQPDGGDVAERLLYGTRIAVTGRQGDWYRVRYDTKGNEGWVHKNALAM
jgi:hypothetical protein